MIRWDATVVVYIAGFLVAVPLLGADVRVTVNTNRGERATAEHQFAEVPRPSSTDAANRAVWTIVEGRRDRNGADVRSLNDGQVADHEDQPSANFFFAAGTSGGRLLLDLRDVTPIYQVNTYSWHRTTRAPQVYRLYGHAGAADGEFETSSASKENLAEAGWTHLADVDTRDKAQAEGGQVGVNITEANGEPLGAFRYLLLVVSATEDEDAFGNTFFSEIDVHDGKEHPLPMLVRKTETVVIDGKYEMTIDMTEVPEIEPWIREKLIPVCIGWYPKIVAMLPSDGYEAPQRFTIVFHRDMQGVANTAGTRVNCAGPWFMRNLDGEAAGAVVHELVHVVQQYRRTRRANRNPGWMVEGVADYIRWFLYEPENLRPRPNPRRANYTDSYRTTAAFLSYVTHEHDADVVKKFNAAMREGRYSGDLWHEYTGKTVDELWADYIKTLETP